MLPPTRTGGIHLLLASLAIIVMLTWGTYAVFWTYPNDQGGTLNAVLNGELSVTGYRGTGNGSTIRPGTEDQFIMIFKTNPGNGGGGFISPDGKNFIVGPFLWTAPSPTGSTWTVQYAVFTFSFSAQPPGTRFPLWFTGPQGNISESIHTDKYGGLPTNIGQNFDTGIFELSAPGNYTLHYFNYGSTNATGLVAMGPSSVTYSRPYLFPGATTITFAGVLSAVTLVLLRKKNPQIETGAKQEDRKSVEKDRLSDPIRLWVFHGCRRSRLNRFGPLCP